MSKPKIIDWGEEISLNKSVGPNIADFLFHLIYDVDGRPISPSINPNKIQLALINITG